MLYNAFSSLRIFQFQSNVCFKIVTISTQQKRFANTATRQPHGPGPETGQNKPKRTPIPKITLISQDNVSITTLEEAQKLSKRRDLKLVKIIDQDNKTHRPVYKLMTGTEYHAEDLKQREERKKEKLSSALKGEKLLILSSNISEHDLQTQINKILKWIAKKYEVRVVINGSISNMEKAESVYKFLEDHVHTETRIVQKRTKGSDLKFQMLPPKKNKENMENS